MKECSIIVVEIDLYSKARVICVNMYIKIQPLFINSISINNSACKVHLPKNRLLRNLFVKILHQIGP